MSDYGDTITQLYAGSQRAAVANLLEDPEKAARAVELSDATGAAPTTIYGDVDSFERNHKAALASNIISNNSHIADYVNSHPLASTISNDDYGALDKASQSMTKLGLTHVVRASVPFLGGVPTDGSVVSAAIEGFKAGSGLEELEAEHKELLDKLVPQAMPFSPYIQQALSTSPAISIPTAIAASMRLFGGAITGAAAGGGAMLQQLGMSESGANSAVRDAIVMANILMATPGGAGIHMAPEMAAKISDFHSKVGPYVEAGEKPPIGLHKLVDDAAKEQAKNDAKSLDEATKDIQSTNTFQRSPEFAKKFIATHGDMKMGIDVDAIMRLYGEKLPEAGDGKLGDVPGIIDQYEAALHSGGDVAIHFSDWAMLDSAIHDELHDDVRVRPGGLTLEEGKNLSKVEEPKVEEGVEPTQPTPVDLVRQSAALDRGLDLEDRLNQMREARDKLAGGEWYDYGRGVKAFIKPAKLWTDHEVDIATAIGKVFDQILPKDVDLQVAQRVSLKGAKSRTEGIYTQFEDRKPLILIALNADDPVGTLWHEATHQLRQEGFFTEQEWGVLEKTATDNEWMSKFDIKSRYPGLSKGEHLEEAIAEGIKYHSKSEAKAEGPIAKIIERIKELFESIKDAIRSVTGREPTFERLFKKVESGQIGSRQPTGPLADTSYRGPKASQGELDVTRMEDKDAFAKANAIGMTVDQYRRYMKLIDQRKQEDLDAATKSSLENQRKQQTKEWKANQTDMRQQVSESINSRPDVGADNLLRTGNLYGEKIKAPKLEESALTPEQRKGLPEGYVARGGVLPDDLAGLFGYSSGEGLVQRLVELNAAREASGLKGKGFVEKLIDAETERQMQAKYGSLKDSIMSEAKDQALSETQFDLLHEETLALATQAGLEFSLTKEQMKAQVKENFSRQIVDNVSSDKLLATAGKAGRATEDALLKDDPAEAFRQRQRQYWAVLEATEAKKFEKQLASFNKMTKRLSGREQPSMLSEYTNFIHEILMRIGKPVKRSVQDLEGEIAASPFKDFKAFVQNKTDNYREIPIAEFLFDSNYRKPFEQMSVDEFQQVNDSIKTMAKQGRDEKKIIREGDVEDRKVVTGGMEKSLQTFPLKEASLQKGLGYKVKSGFRTFNIGIINAETWMNRWDRDDSKGWFNQWLVRPLSQAANRKATLDREFAKPYQALGAIEDMYKLVESPFVDPLSKTEDNPNGNLLVGFTRKNIAAMISNAGNKYNWNVLTKGYEAEPNSTYQWLINNSTKADWVRAEGMGRLFDKGFGLAETVYRNTTGVAPARIELEPFTIQFSNGETFTSNGWYHPIIRDRERTNLVRKLNDQEPLGKEPQLFASVANGYTKQRTGAIDVLALDHDQIPAKLNQILHDVAFRQEVIEASKIIKDRSLRQEIVKHYGRDYVDMLDDWLKDIAGGSSYDSHIWAKAAQLSNYARANVIGTLIGFNPYTVMKHGPTALVNSMYEAGTKAFSRTFTEVSHDYFRSAVQNLFGKGDEVGETQWQFGLKNSEELQRRARNWSETIVGQHKDLYGLPTLRETIIEQGSRPVAFSDLISAVPTWLAKYGEEFAKDGDHGQAVFQADRAVRRAHGSTAITNQPELVRGGGPMHSWLTSLYGFFGTQMQRRAEIAFKANDIYQLGREGELKAAAKNMPGLMGLVFSAMVWPTIIEEVVSKIGTDDHRSGLERLAYGAFSGFASSFLYLRDIAYSVATDRDPSVGLASTPMHDLRNVIHDIKRGSKIMSKDHAGKTVEDFITLFGDVKGMTPKIVGHAARFGINVGQGVERPKTLSDWSLGLTKGTMKRRIEK